MMKNILTQGFIFKFLFFIFQIHLHLKCIHHTKYTHHITAALCIRHVFGLQMIFETGCTSMVTNFMSTVCAVNFCPIDQTIWQCFEGEFAIHKSFLHFLSLSLFQSAMFFPNANPASSSSDSLSYFCTTLWIKTTGAINGCKSNNAHFFLILSINRMLKKYGIKRHCTKKQFQLRQYLCSIKDFLSVITTFCVFYIY